MLRTLGLLFIALVVAAGVAGGYWYIQQHQARLFVESLAPAIFRDWNASALKDRSVALLRTPGYEAEVGDMFQWLSQGLGPFESAAPFEGTLQLGHVDPRLPLGLYGRYKAHAKFREAEGDVEFVVFKEQGTWRICNFNVQSPALVEAAKNLRSVKPVKEAWVHGPAEEEAAVLAEAGEILRLLDSENPGDTWRRASILFQQAEPKRRFVARLSDLREKTGHLQGRKLDNVGFMFNRPGADPPGDYAVADYVATYSHDTLRERFGFYKQEGRWLFAGYHWQRVEPAR